MEFRDWLLPRELTEDALVRPAPTGRHMTAQGNALGIVAKSTAKP